ncbi:MAG: hypothetical protein CMI31_13185 [Opitutae bacterium]|nr:hypothetical protein [Opitutae bacterium]
MKKLIYFPLLLSLFLTSLLCGQEDEEEPARAWTNKAGRTIIAQFVEADDKTVIISIKGQRHTLQLSDLSESSQRLAAELQAVSTPDPEPKPEPQTPTEEAATEKSLLDQEHQWKNSAGKIITAKFVRANDSAVTLFFGGREIPVPLNSLSTESQELASKLRKMVQSDEPATTKPGKPAIDLAKDHQWTNAAGKTLTARFVSADDEKITLLIGGREYPLPFASLSKESQKQAAQFRKAWEASKPPEPKVIQGSGNRMAYYGNGDWKYYNTVFKSDNFDAALHYNGRSMHVWFKERGSRRGAGDGARTGSGKPITINFNMRYYDRTEPKRVRHRTRKVVSIEKEWEVDDDASKCIKIVRGTLDNNGTFEVGFDFNHKSLGVWGKVKDLPSEKWPTRVHLGVRVPKCINWTDEMRPKDWDPLLGDAAIHITPVEGPQARLPLNMTWLDLKKKFGHTNPAKEALVFGKPWGDFKVRVTPRAIRDASFNWGKGYTGVFPFQGFYFGYHMSEYSEIPRAKRLDLIVYR